MANFFQSPMIPRVTNPEPAGFNLIRQMLMNQMFRRNANPYGMSPGGQTGGNPLFPSGGRGTFDPYGGMMTNAFSPGGTGQPGGGGSTGTGVGNAGGEIPLPGGYIGMSDTNHPGMPGYTGPAGGGGYTSMSRRGGGWGGGGNAGGWGGRPGMGGGNNFMQMLQNFLQQYQGGGQGRPRSVGPRMGGETPGGATGIGIGGRTPSPGAGPIAPRAGGETVTDTSGPRTATPPPTGGTTYDPNQFQFDGERMGPTNRFGPPSFMPGFQPGFRGFGGGTQNVTPRDSGGGRMGPVNRFGPSELMPGFQPGFRGFSPGPPSLQPRGPMQTATPPTPRGRPFGGGGFDGDAEAEPESEYDGRRDIAKAVHNHMAMMKSVLPMLMNAPRVASAAPSMTSGGPMPGYDGAMMTRPGGGYAPYDGMAPETAPSWTPLSERSGGTGINQASNVPNTLPSARDVPPLPRPGYDGFTGTMERARGPAPSYDAIGSNDSLIPISGDSTGGTGSSMTYPDPGGSASPYPTGAQTGGQAMYPWLMPYTGQRTAAMSPYEMQGLQSMSDFVGGGMGTGASQTYLNDLLGGKYVGSDNPYMQQFQQGAQTLKDSEDALARQRIGSSMAAGGNALSGARLASEQQYQNLSDAQFQKMLAEMQMQNLARERALQQGGVGLQAGLGSEMMGGYSQLMNAGAVPRNIQQGDFNSQYQDWLRQIGAMNQQDQFQQNLATQMLHTSPGAYQPGYGTSEAAGIAGLLAGSGIGDLLKKLLGGGSSSSKGGGGGGPSVGGGGGGKPGQDANGNTPRDAGYDPSTDPANIGAEGYDPYNYNNVEYDPETGTWHLPSDTSSLDFGGWNPEDYAGYDPTGGYDPGYGEFGYDPTGGYDMPSGDTTGYGDYFTSGEYDYPTYGDTSGDWSGWG